MTTQAPGREANPARKVGYLVAVIVNAVMWVLVNVRPGWRELPFLTEDFLDILWLVNLSLVTSAVVNLVYLFFDPTWFKSVSQIGVLAVGMAASILMWQIFPFDFSSYLFPWDAMTRVLLGLAIFGSFVAVVVELVKLAKLASRQPPAASQTRELDPGPSPTSDPVTLVTTRQDDTDRFYALLHELSDRVGGPRKLSDGTPQRWPVHGILFFCEDGEDRCRGSHRIVRVDTHALTARSAGPLWQRLCVHRGAVSGSRPGGGDHRASNFRMRVGSALLSHDQWPGARFDRTQRQDRARISCPTPGRGR